MTSCISSLSSCPARLENQCHKKIFNLFGPCCVKERPPPPNRCAQEAAIASLPKRRNERKFFFTKNFFAKVKVNVEQGSKCHTTRLTIEKSKKSASDLTAAAVLMFLYRKKMLCRKELKKSSKIHTWGRRKKQVFV